tara:strand:- start:106 stop:1302 length:1197 start_codon:yes stop_codon:yes gene_type:complete
MPKTSKTKSPTVCNFCQKHKDAVMKLIIGDNVGICNECVDFCVQILKDTELKKDNINLDPIIIKEYLDCYVIGQNDAKIALSVAVANHYKRLQAQVKNVEVNKANLLMIGPTGCGKTMLAKTIARYLNVPFTIADATSLTEAGYVGDDVETILQKLLYASDHDIEKAQQGIVFIDEIDKISRKSESASITRDVSGEGVQQAMLKIIEGCQVRVNLQGNRKHPMGDAVEMDTSNILFILGGSFVGLEKIVQKRLDKGSIGFEAPLANDELTGDIVPDDLVKYGLIPELIGRLTNMTRLDRLTNDELQLVLTKVRNNLIDQYQYLFSLDNIKLDVTKDAVNTIVNRCIQLNTGARGLHSEIEKVLTVHMYNVGRYRRANIKELVIDQSQVESPQCLIKAS